MVRKLRFERFLLRVGVGLLGLLVFCGVTGAQQTQPPAKVPESKVPAADAQKSNPVKPTPDSLARGKKLYGIDCAMCHGENGDGKGDADIKNVTDFTNADLQKARTDGEWFHIIRKGRSEMPPEGDRAKDDDVWSLVNYIRTFAKK